MRLAIIVLILTIPIPAAGPPQIIATPYVAPTLQFWLESGKPVKGDVLQCVQERESLNFADHGDAFVVLICNNGIRLRVNYLRFDENKITIRVDSVR